MRKLVISVAALAAACDTGGVSSAEVREAAIERARSEFGLGPNAPVDAKVWVGREYDGDISICGTVSSAGARMTPKRFMASVEPFEWLIFEDAHDPMVTAHPPASPSWGSHCAPSAVSGTVATTENEPCGTRMDSNENGVIEEAEYNSFGFAFDNWDTDDDYAVSPAEFGRCWSALGWGGEAQQAFATFDQDDDGSLSQQEFFSPGHFEQFARLAQTGAAAARQPVG